jgi:hypothetical protein
MAEHVGELDHMRTALELEDDLIAGLDLPLNLEGNSRNEFHQVLIQARARCASEANALPALPNPGIGGR